MSNNGIETIKAIARKKTWIQSDLVDLVSACQEAAKYYSTLIEEEGSTVEGPRVRYLRDEVRRVYQGVLTQKEPAVTEDSVRRLEKCIELLTQVSQKEPAKKKLQFDHRAHTDDTQQEEHAHDDQHHDAPEEEGDGGEEGDEDSMDSEERYLEGLEADRRANRAQAAWHVRFLHLLTAVVLILACIGVIFVSSDQYDDAVEMEKRTNAEAILSILSDGVDTIVTAGVAAGKNLSMITIDAEALFNDLSSLHVTPQSPPFFVSSETPLFEFLTVRFTFNSVTGDRIINRYVSRKAVLMCVEETTARVIQPDDLQYGSNFSGISVLNSQAACGTQTSGSGIWKRIGSNFFTYFPRELTYRNVYAMQIGTMSDGAGIGIEVQIERDSLQDTIQPRSLLGGVINPLVHQWQQDTALWAAFTIAFGILFMMMASEMTIWAAKEEFFSDFSALIVYASCVGLISLTVVIVTGAISWTFLEDELNGHRLRHIELQTRTIAMAVSGPTMRTLGTAPDFLSLIANNSAYGKFYYTSNAATGGISPATSDTLRASALSQSFAFTQSGEYYREDTIKDGSSLHIYCSYFLTSIQGAVTVFRNVGTSNMIFEAGQRSAGPTMAVLGAQLVLIIVYYLLTPLRDIWPYAIGAVWQEEWLRPHHYRRVLYVVVAVTTIATCLSVAFYAVAEASQVNMDFSPTNSLVVTQALASGVQFLPRASLNVLNDGLPSFADAFVFTLPTDSASPVPFMLAECEPRFPIPNWNRWEASFYGAAMPLSNITTSAIAPAYFTPIASANTTFVNPGGVIWAQMSTAAMNNTIGVSLQRLLTSFSTSFTQAYRIYASFMFAAVLATAIALVLFEVFYRSASNARSMDLEDQVNFSTLVMYGLMLLPAFAVLIGAGGSASIMGNANDIFVRDELSWGVVAMRPILERVASLQVTNNAGVATVLSALAAVVDDMNLRSSTTLRDYSRWVLLQEANDFVLDKVFPIAGSDAHNSFYMPDLDHADVIPATGVISSSFFSKETSRPLTYALIEIDTFMNQLDGPKPTIYLMLAVDGREAEKAHEESVIRVFKVSGTCVVILTLLFMFVCWYNQRLFQGVDFVVMDVAEIFPALAHNEANEFAAPPMLPRQLRLLHIFFFLIPVCVLVFFTASTLYGAATARSTFEHPMTTGTVPSDLTATVLRTFTTYWEYLVSSLPGPLQTFNDVVTATSNTSFAGYSFYNASTGPVIASNLQTIASIGPVIAATTPRFDQHDLVGSFQESYHAITVSMLDNDDDTANVIVPMGSILGWLELYAQNIGRSVQYATSVPSTFNATALLGAMHATAKSMDIANKLLVLERIAVAALLDFSTADTNVSLPFYLGPNASDAKSAIRAINADLYQRFDAAVTEASDLIKIALAGDSKTMSLALANLNRAKTEAIATSVVNDPADPLWPWQQKRIQEIAIAAYGDNGTLQNAIALAQATMAASVMETQHAIDWEGEALRSRDFVLGMRSSVRPLSQFMWPSLRPWTVFERYQTARDLGYVYTTAVATTILCIFFAVIFFALLSVLSSYLAENISHDLASHAVGQVGDDDDDSLLYKTSLRHRNAHTRRLQIVVVSLLLVCVPVGMTYWVTTTGLSNCSSIVIAGEQSIQLENALRDMQTVKSHVLYYTSEAFAQSDISLLLAAVEEFTRLLLTVETIVVDRNRVALRRLQSLQGVNADVSQLPDAVNLHRVGTIADTLRKSRRILDQLVTNITAELQEFQAMNVGDNMSQPVLMTQKVAAMYARRLISAGTIRGAYDDVLCPIAPFSSGSSLAAFVQSTYDSLQANISSAGSSLAAVRRVAQQLSNYPEILSSGLRAPTGFLDFWALQTSGSRKNFTTTVNLHGNFTFFSASSLATTGLSRTVQSDIAAMFYGLEHATAPFPSAALQLFANAAPLSPSMTFEGTDLAVQLTAPAAAATYFTSSPTFATFRQRFAFNRNMFSTEQLLLNSEYTISFYDLFDQLDQNIKNISLELVGLPEIMQVQPDRDVDSLTSTAAVPAPPPYQTGNMEYVAVAAQWSCVVAFWLTCASFMFLVMDLRVLHL